tara:strand:- start:1920 stop:2744 length:825 start_codon:yes stop_codon:yes gene_type:complete
MAELIELDEDRLEDSEVETSDLPDTVTEQPQETETPELVAEEVVENAQEEVPEKYRDKSVTELVEMHQNAEKALGKQGGEVGALRKMVDDYIQNQIPQQSQQKPKEPVEDADFFSKPQEAIDSAIANHPAIKAAQEATQGMNMEAARNHLLAKHPDVKATLQDPKFAEWVSSSKYRQKQFIAGEVNLDLDAVDELMTGWAERKSFVTKTVSTETKARKADVKDASTGSTKSSSGGARKAIYRRADIIKLIQTDPDRYEALSPEINQAYREGRVK